MGYRTGVAVNDSQTVQTNTATVTIPASAQVGDVALFTMSQNSAAATGTPPTGWTQVIAPVTSSANNQRIWLWKRQLVAGDPGSSVTFTSSVIARFIGILEVWSGVDFANVAATGGQNGATNSTSHVSPTITTTVAGTFIANLWGIRSGTATAFTVTVPAGHTASTLVRTAFSAQPNYTIQSSRLTTPGAAGTYGGGTATPSASASPGRLTTALPPASQAVSGSATLSGSGILDDAAV